MRSISVKNIYWMIVYALRLLDDNRMTSVATEEFENIYDLLALMLCQELKRQVKRGLFKDYILQEDELTILKGKINVNKSLRNNSMLKKKLLCEYDEYSKDVLLNQVVKTAGYYLISSDKIRNKNILRDLQTTLKHLHGVSLIYVKSINWAKIKFHRNNSSYRVLIQLAHLILDGLLVNTDDGAIFFRDYIDETKLHILYEKFILGYYQYHYPELNPSLPHIAWIVSEEEHPFLPTMKTDIVLTFQNRTLIIDAKYYSSIFQRNPLYDKETFYSGNLYQIYTYVKNKDIHKDGSVSGLLLYALADDDALVDVCYQIDGNTIRIANLDMRYDFEIVANKLNSIADCFKNNE